MNYVISIIFLLFISISFLSMFTLYKKRDHFEGYVGFKSYLSTACFFGIGILGFVAHVLNFLGVIVWVAIIILLMVGAAFIKYLPKPKETL